MTGISARETTRSSRRQRPQASGKSTAVAPPVLFRLPPVALPAAGDTPHVAAPYSPGLGDTARMSASDAIASNPIAHQSVAGTYSGGTAGGVAGSQVAGTNSVPHNSVPGPQSATSPQSAASPVQMSGSMPGTDLPGNDHDAKVAGTNRADTGSANKKTLAASKSRGQQLLNTLIALVLLLALVVITWVSVKQPHRGAEIVQDDASKSNTGNSALDSLGQLDVPKVSMGNTDASPVDAAEKKVAETSPKTNDSLDLTPADSSTTSAVSLPTASVSLGAPTPMASAVTSLAGQSPTSNSSLANNSSSNNSSSVSTSLPLTTPRYDTVSNSTSAPKTVFEATSNGSSTTSSPTISSAKSDSSPNGGSTSGGSPSLWDGARSSLVPETQAGGLTISKPMSAEISMTPPQPSNANTTSTGPGHATATGTNAPSSTTTNASSELTNSFLLGQSSKSGTSSTGTNATALSGSVPNTPVPNTTVPGVTVGGGLKSPGNLSETQTPNLDVAQLSQQYVEYARQKSLTGAPASQPINQYQLAPQDARQSVATSINSYTQTYPTSAPQIQSPTGGPINSYAQAGSPYGVTGGTTTPYVRNAPGTSAPVTSAPGISAPGTSAPATAATLASGPTQLPAGLPSYQTSGPQNGYTVPPRAGTAAAPTSTTAPYSANSAATGAGVISGANGYGATPGAGYPNTAYPSPSYSQPTNTPPVNNQPGYTQPGYPQPGYTPPVNNQPGYTQPGYPQTNYAQPTLMQTSGGTPSASVPPRNVMPVNNLYPGGQAPVGLIGQAGFATAPSGDFTPTPPIPVSGTVGYGTSSPSNMGTLQLGR